MMAVMVAGLHYQLCQHPHHHLYIYQLLYHRLHRHHHRYRLSHRRHHNLHFVHRQHHHYHRRPPRLQQYLRPHCPHATIRRPRLRLRLRHSKGVHQCSNLSCGTRKTLYPTAPSLPEVMLAAALSAAMLSAAAAVLIRASPLVARNLVDNYLHGVQVATPTHPTLRCCFTRCLCCWLWKDTQPRCKPFGRPAIQKRTTFTSTSQPTHSLSEGPRALIKVLLKAQPAAPTSKPFQVSAGRRKQQRPSASYAAVAVAAARKGKHQHSRKRRKQQWP
mmetsp:Transcript_70001/g.140908  ORF Transcript_70001/g.140908 Transcript_70001/m.140908 type:complete len:274 (+) Transcript_70001:1126-1947(+)